MDTCTSIHEYTSSTRDSECACLKLVKILCSQTFKCKVHHVHLYPRNASGVPKFCTKRSYPVTLAMPQTLHRFGAMVPRSPTAQRLSQPAGIPGWIQCITVYHPQQFQHRPQKKVGPIASHSRESSKLSAASWVRLPLEFLRALHGYAADVQSANHSKPFVSWSQVKPFHGIQMSDPCDQQTVHQPWTLLRPNSNIVASPVCRHSEM
jgi:hypothetical protein